MPILQDKQVGPIGLGLMGFTWRSNPCSLEQAFETMRAALANGCNFWNGGEFYGPPGYNSLVLLEKYFEKYPEDADKVVLSIKGGVNPETHVVDGSPENTRRSLDNTLAQLKGRKKLDFFEFGRRDQNVPMEETFKLIQEEYINTGKLGGISLSEVRAETIHEAVKYIKVAFVEVEVSLFSTDIFENGVAAACAQYGIPIVGYSPIGRGMLTGQFRKLEDIKDPIFHSYKLPRFQPGNFEKNLALVQRVEEIAKGKNCTPAQLAINWTRAVSRRPGMPTVVPIPGATTVERVTENSQVIDLTDEELAQIDSVLAGFTPAGGRYGDNIPSNT
ncbi:voltage-gated shaker-like K+ channel, subunit [Xylaria bambusicola]|uniref:voltage-gated shaker-like K+ channel, subunit n=1 Tax=Xylaria bambusicola TaxID=326684 RepID=UPI0020076CD4|nr:voltage-gated shaker-like K+ channel, subunit [Xylaria bambusicola]KAI0503136.1 voltage-gated shaker-like K+ channel, subunit [Xylaria bambusicola]